MSADPSDEIRAGSDPPAEGADGSEVLRGPLPDPGADSSWEVVRSEAGGTAVLRVGCDGVRAVFTTRLGGVSPPPADSLNLSPELEPVGASARERVLANRRVAGAAVGRGADWSTVRQVHGTDVVRAPEPGVRPGADALWTDDPDRTLAITVADCVAILLVGEGAVAAVHAGWRGLVAGVVEAAAKEVGARRAFAGPAIGPCCFEVGPEVIEAFVERWGPGVAPDGRHVDLWAAAAEAAKGSGVGSLSPVRLCTSCHPRLFFSHRRDGGRTGRQGLVAVLDG